MSQRITRIKNGLDADQKQIARDVKNAVAILQDRFALLVHMITYMYDTADDPASDIVESADLSAYTPLFKSEVAKLLEVMNQAQAIDDLNDPDPAVASAARTLIDGWNAGKPAFDTRYDPPTS